MGTKAGVKSPNSDDDIYITSKELSSQPESDSDSTAPDHVVKNRKSSVIPTPGFRYRAFFQRHRAWIITAVVALAIAIILLISLPVYFHHKHEVALDTLQPPTINVTLTDFNASTNPYNITTPPVRMAALWNFADPTFYHDKETNMWWAFATNGGAGILKLLPAGSNDSAVQALLNATGSNRRIPNFQVATSPDFTNWTVLPALNPVPTLGSWTLGSNITTNSTTTTTTITPTISLVPTSTSTSTTFYPYASTLYPTLAGAPTPLTFPTFNYSSNSTAYFGPPPGPQNISFSTTHGANTWAPEVLRNPLTGNYIMYYSATSLQYPSAHCIGAAESTSGIAGPYIDQNPPLACQGTWGGAIDPSIFIDTLTTLNTTTNTNETSTTLYLTYKIDGNSHGLGGECFNTIPPLTSTPILLQRLSPSGLEAVGEPIYLLDRDTDEGDGPLVEAPSLVKVGGMYVLFYSSGCTRNADYDVRIATAERVEGPWVRRGVVLKTGDFGALYAPGSVTVRTSNTYQTMQDGEGDEMTGVTGVGENGEPLWYIMFHARVVTKSGGIRAVFTAGLEFVEAAMQGLSGKSVVKGGSRERTGLVRLISS